MNVVFRGEPEQIAEFFRAWFVQGRLFCTGNDAEMLVGLDGVGSPGATRPLGFVRGGRAVEDYFGNFHFFPVTLTFRPLMEPISRFKPQLWSIAERSTLVGNDDCVMLRRYYNSENPSEYYISWWVSMDKGAVVRRTQRVEGGVVLHQLDIDYSQDSATATWVPKSWRISASADDGSPLLLSVGQMVHYDLNATLTDSDVEVDFPVGTRVRDTTRGADDAAEYVVQHDGVHREILKHELGMPHDKLMATRPGQAVVGPETAAEHSSTTVRWLRILSSALLVGAILAYLTFRSRRSSS